MLARRKVLALHDTDVAETPLLVPAFSSRVSDELRETLMVTKDGITDAVLISAYDVHHRKFGDDLDLSFARLVFLDSGAYEHRERSDLSDPRYSNSQSAQWDRNLLESVLDDWSAESRNPPTVVVSYDCPGSIPHQVREARELFSGRSGVLKELLLKPDHAQYYLDPRVVIEHLHLLAPFDILGLTEPEVGNSLLQKMKCIATIRLAMQAAGVEVPIHIFGGLDTISTPLYYIAGADIFDGLSWLRYAYDHGRAIYWRNYGALADGIGIHVSEDRIRTRSWGDNLSALDDLTLRMQSFQFTGDFAKLGDDADFFRDCHSALCGALGREV